MEKLKLGVLIGISILLVGSTGAVTETEAENAIGNASERIEDVQRDDVPAQRLEDLLLEANQTYNARKSLENPSYERVIDLTSQIQSLSDDAVRAKDEIKVLREEIQIAESENVNVTKARSLLSMAEEDLSAGRYEESLDDVDRAYSALSEARALSVQIETFYQEESENIINYIENNTRKLGMFLVIGLTGSILSIRELRLLHLRRVKKRLKRKEESVAGLIKDLEERYYEKQDMPKKAFEIRKDKFQQIRDDAQTRIPEIEKEIENKFAIQKFILR